MLTVLLVLVGIYVYFVLGYLNAELHWNLKKIEATNDLDEFLGNLLAATFLPIILTMNVFLLLAKCISSIPKYKIPFTPAAVARKIASGELFKFRIKIVKE